jgi:hypothetical protein
MGAGLTLDILTLVEHGVVLTGKPCLDLVVVVLAARLA